MLLLAPSMLVPCLRHHGVKVWDTLAIGEYLHEIKPKAGLLPADRAARAHCRAVCGEMHSGFVVAALGAADEPEGALPRLQGVEPGAERHRARARDLERVPGHLRRALPVRRAQHGRCDVRAGGDPRCTPTTCASPTRPAPPTASASWRCPKCRSGSPPPSSSPRTSTSSRWSSDQAPQPLDTGTSHTGVDVDGVEVGRADDLQVFHVRRVVEQVVHARPGAGARSRRH